MNFFERVLIPFKIAELFSGFAEGKGILRVDESGLTMEYQVQDAIFGVLKSSVRTLKISYDDIEHVELQRRWWKRKLIIHTNSLRIPASIPGNNNGYIVVHIRRADRERAKLALSRMELLLSESRLKQLDAW